MFVDDDVIESAASTWLECAQSHVKIREMNENDAETSTETMTLHVHVTSAKVNRLNHAYVCDVMYIPCVGDHDQGGQSQLRVWAQQSLPSSPAACVYISVSDTVYQALLVGASRHL